jgi:endonuclease/exonuclease/phosphatase (EEP) superfamily protein YafD
MHQIRKPVRRSVRPAGIAITLVTALVTSSCAHQYVDEPESANASSVAYATPTESNVAGCKASLAAQKESAGFELDGSAIRLLNWNIQKERQLIWDEEFQSRTSQTDLVLMQEASLRHDTIEGIDSSKHWSFAPGYTLDGEITGVMTLSRSRPLTQCSFVTLEPLLRTPKATSVTEYALSGSDETLVVVNIHAVNFSWGTGAFREQFAQVQDVLKDHEGPIILSGDFNTWRKRRIEIVDEIAASLSLESVTFGYDQRVRIFGNVLDHIFVRGLSPVDADTEVVKTSDHNPMSVTLKL